MTLPRLSVCVRLHVCMLVSRSQAEHEVWLQGTSEGSSSVCLSCEVSTCVGVGSVDSSHRH